MTYESILEDALARLVVDCENYMRNYEKLGGGHIMTGRCWDKMRKATDKAHLLLAAVVAGESLESGERKPINYQPVDKSSLSR